jgi:hypothetical protein
MNFKQKSIKGKSRKLYKEWFDETKQYRIVWTKEVSGIRVPPHYFATVRIILPDSHEMWDFVDRRGSYKTFKKAVEACDVHKRLWINATEANGIRKLKEPFGKMPVGIPVWVKKNHHDLYKLLINSSKIADQHG